LTMINALRRGLQEARVSDRFGALLLLSLGDPLDFGEIAAIEHVNFMTIVNALTVAGPPCPLTPPIAAAAAASTATGAQGAATTAAPAVVVLAPQAPLNPTGKGRIGTFHRICRLKAGMVADEGGTWRHR
jgi:hypothetical protein